MKFYQTKKFHAILKRIGVAADNSRVAYALEGGNAVDMLANPPATKDIDILVSGRTDRFMVFVKEMQAQKFRLKESYEDEGFALLFFVCKTTKIEVDVKWSIHDSLLNDAVSTARGLFGFFVVRPEMLICLKTQAYSDRRARRDAIAVRSLWKTLKRKMDTRWLMGALRKIGMLGVFTAIVR